MTVGELIKELQNLDPNAPVDVSIGNPKDSAYTNEVMVFLRKVGEGVETPHVEIHGWVSSDNEDAFAPWAD